CQAGFDHRVTAPRAESCHEFIGDGWTLQPHPVTQKPVDARRCNCRLDIPVMIDHCADDLKDRRKDAPTACGSERQERDRLVTTQHECWCGIRSRTATRHESMQMRLAGAGREVVVVNESQCRMSDFGAKHRL